MPNLLTNNLPFSRNADSPRRCKGTVFVNAPKLN
jgi:hypothetical protein